VAKKKPKPQAKVVYRYKLRNFRQLEDKPGEHKRQAINIKTGQVISRREFVARAKKEVVIQKPKEKSTIHEKRVKWYANHYNHEEFDRMVGAGTQSGDYISFDDVESDSEFRMYEDMIHSRDAELRELAYDYFEELEDEYLNEDWGETPGAA
jgi:hypothetical protein